MNKFLLIAFLVFCSVSLTGQFIFTNLGTLPLTAIKNQETTSGSWCFIKTSLIESQILRLDLAQVDLSDAYLVNQIFQDKANNYILCRAKAVFSQGGRGCDLLRAMDRVGAPQAGLYGGRINSGALCRSKLERALCGFLWGVLKCGKPSNSWILDYFWGKPKTDFNYTGKNYTAKNNSSQWGIKTQDNVELTSYTFYPFDAKDSVSLIAQDDNICEKRFSDILSLGVIQDSIGSNIYKNPISEKRITKDTKPESFANFTTTDDHLMHLMGNANDQKGNNFYILKNACVKFGPCGGNIYLCESYVRLKTVGIISHKTTLPKSECSKLPI